MPGGSVPGVQQGHTAVALAAAVRAGRTSARDQVEEALDRIAALDPGIGAFQVVRAQRARAEADAVDGRADRFSLPLAGVPVAVKDNVPVEGEPLRNGSLATSPDPQPRSHEVVRRLRRAGAVVVGLTRVPELCTFGSTDSPFGITRNPLDPSLSPGGSSGGSAAAVAAGMVTVAHGNDGMGSLRIPAACTGLVGVKPGTGVVPAGLGADDWSGMAENGPLARTVDDAALVLAVLADDVALAQPLPLPTRLRVGTSVRPPVPGTPVHAGYRAAVELVAEVLARAGHQVREDPLAVPVDAGLAALARWFAGTSRDAATVAAPERLQRRNRRHALVGRAVLAAGGPRPGAREAWIRRARRWFTDHDVLVTPALAAPPKRAVAWSDRGWLANLVSDARYAPFASPWNLAGWPALALPVAAADPGARVPPSVQLVVPPGGERLLLAVARFLEPRVSGSAASG